MSQRTWTRGLGIGTSPRRRRHGREADLCDLIVGPPIGSIRAFTRLTVMLGVVGILLGRLDPRAVPDRRTGGRSWHVARSPAQPLP